MSETSSVVLDEEGNVLEGVQPFKEPVRPTDAKLGEVAKKVADVIPVDDKNRIINASGQIQSELRAQASVKAGETDRKFTEQSASQAPQVAKKEPWWKIFW
jgi:hypothetical protein